jgi:TolA-binding protein
MWKCLFIFVLMLMISSSFGLDYNGYRLNLDPAEYAKLDTFERAQYRKAVNLAESGQYRAAAGEFEKFKVQLGDSSILPYMIFMKGYCLHMQKDRHSAIKVYNEVLDYFGNDIVPASSAIYFLGVAYLENGDTKKGIETMDEMVQDADYSKHPLAAGALAALADNNWKNGKQNVAVKYWKQSVKDFKETNPREAGAARDAVINYYVVNKNYVELDSWGIPPDKKSDNTYQRWFSGEVYRNVYYGFTQNKSGYEFNKFKEKHSNETKKAYLNYYVTKKSFFEQDDDMWTYYSRLVTFLSRIYTDETLLNSTIAETISFIAKTDDESLKDSRLGTLVDRLRDDKKYAQAEILIAKINDKVLAEWKRESVLEIQFNWEAAIKKLDEIAEMSSKYLQRCNKRKGEIYMHSLHKYDSAIKSFRDADYPPGSLWQIAECQYRMADLKGAITTLSEIENSFPDESANAAWKKVEYYKGADDIKQGIANARRIMKMYPNSSASSKAHQYLEGYGIATGGGVL